MPSAVTTSSDSTSSPSPDSQPRAARDAATPLHSTDPLAPALAAHRAGELREAELQYRQILKTDPHRAEAWHLLGLVAQATGHLAQAEEFITRALKLGSHQASIYHNNLGTTLASAGRVPEAIQEYRKALRLRPDYPEALRNLARSYREIGQSKRATLLLRRLTDEQAADPETLQEKVYLHQEAGEHKAAAETLRQLLQLQPHNLSAILQLGQVLLQAGRPGRAVPLLAKAAERMRSASPNSQITLPSHQPRGTLNTANPSDTDSGTKTSASQAPVEVTVSFPQVLTWWAKALVQDGRPAEALPVYDQLLALSTAGDQSRDSRSIQSQAAEPVVADSQATDVQEADSETAGGDRGDPASEGIPEDLAQRRREALLLAGRWSAAWAEPAQRVSTTRPELTQLRWWGGPLEGHPILLHADETTSETLLYLRYAQLVQEAGGRVVLEIPPRLIPLLRRCPGVSQLIGRGEIIPRCTWQTPLSALPVAFGTTPETVPASVPYIAPDPQLVSAWAERLSRLREDRRLLVGLSWRGDHQREDRSLPLGRLLAALSQPNVSLVSLHLGSVQQELAEIHSAEAIRELGPDYSGAGGAFTDTAAVLSQLDLVICCESVMAHLAGAMGVPAWVVVPRVPDWMWGPMGDRCVWYPSLRLFRQSRPGRWKRVLQDVGDAFAQYLAEGQLNPTDDPSPQQ